MHKVMSLLYVAFVNSTAWCTGIYGVPFGPIHVEIRTRRKSERFTKSHSEEPKVLCLPYVHRLSEKLEKVCAPLGIKAVSKPSNTLRQSLVHVKKRLPEEKKRSVDYQVPHKGCDQVYIGETKRNLKIRLGEHRQPVRRGDDKNGIAVHVQKCNHSIDWEGARVEQVITNYWKRRTAETILIRQQSPTMNLDLFYLLNTLNTINLEKLSTAP